MAKGLVACAQKGESGEAYNLASGVETTIKNLAECINELTGNKTPVDLKPARDWDRSGKRFGATLKSKEKLNFSATVSIENGLARTVDWTRKNKELIQQSMEKHEFMMKNSN